MKHTQNNKNGINDRGTNETPIDAIFTRSYFYPSDSRASLNQWMKQKSHSVKCYDIGTPMILKRQSYYVKQFAPENSPGHMYDGLHDLNCQINSATKVHSNCGECCQAT